MQLRVSENALFAWFPFIWNLENFEFRNRGIIPGEWANRNTVTDWLQWEHEIINTKDLTTVVEYLMNKCFRPVLPLSVVVEGGMKRGALTPLSV